MAKRPVTVEWSVDALADLQRFAVFLQDIAPGVAVSIGREIISKSSIVGERPLIGRPIKGEGRRQLVLRAAKASYVLQYRVDGERVVILRVFHSREHWK